MAARDTERPEEWDGLSDQEPAPHGPYPDYALGVKVACQHIGLAASSASIQNRGGFDHAANDE